MGGLGVKDFSLFRVANQGKHILNLLNTQKSMWTNIVLAKYGPSDPWNIIWSRKMSWVWKGLLRDLNCLKEGFLRHIRNS